MSVTICRVCNKTFDFETEGLGAWRGKIAWLVCSVKCAEAKTTGGEYFHSIKSENDYVTKEKCA